MVSLPAPPAIVVAAPRLTAELKLKVSLPVPPVKISAPPPPVIVLVPLPTVIVLAPVPPVTVRLPVYVPAARLPDDAPALRATVAALLPVRVNVCPVVSAVAVIVFDPLPVAIDSPEATATVVTFKAPLTPVAVRSPCNPVTVSAADPASVNPTLSPSDVALTVTVSVLKLSVIEVAAEPVVMDIVLSVASPVVTVSAPVRDPAVMFPINPVTTSAAEPVNVSAILLASAVALTVTVSVLHHYR